MMERMSIPESQPQTPQILDSERILGAARQAGYSFVRIYDVVDTTNTEIERRLTRGEPREREELGELSVFTTLHMTAGRGRLGRPWNAPAGTSLAASIVVRPHAADSTPLPIESYRWLTMLAGLSVREVWRELGVEADLKWPNDVLINGYKACGILALLLKEPAVHAEDPGALSIVIGIGQNLNMREDQLPVPSATSVLIQRGEKVDNEAVLTRLLSVFAERYRDFIRVQGDPQAPLANGLSLLEQARAATVTLGAHISLSLPDGRTVCGVAVDLDEQGRLLVREDSGTVTAYSVGDIEHVRPANGSYGNFQPAAQAGNTRGGYETSEQTRAEQTS